MAATVKLSMAAAAKRRRRCARPTSRLAVALPPRDWWRAGKRAKLLRYLSDARKNVLNCSFRHTESFAVESESLEGPIGPIGQFSAEIVACDSGFSVLNVRILPRTSRAGGSGGFSTEIRMPRKRKNVLNCSARFLECVKTRITLIACHSTAAARPITRGKTC